MKKEDFIKLGLDEEVAKKCEAASQEELKGFIPKTRFDEVNEEKKKLEGTITERDTQLEELKKTSGDSEALKKQIETLQAENKAKDEAHASEVRQIKLNNAVEIALTNAKSKNHVAVKALLKDLDKAEIAEDGTIKGLSEQLEALQKSDAYLFEEQGKKKIDIKGARHHEGSDDDVKKPDLSKMTYEELAAFMAENPDTEI